MNADAQRSPASGGDRDGRERRLWNERVEAMPRETLRALQWERLQRQMRYDFARSPFLRAKFEAIGATPDDVRSFDDFARIPVTTKDEHRRAQQESIDRHGDPFALLACARPDEIVRINATSGTTGTPTLYTLTAHDVGVVNEMHARKYWRAGIRPGHVMLQALSLSMFTGGLPLSQGIMHLGACVVPVGIEGGTQRVVDIARITRPHAIVATPSFGRYLIEEAPRLTGRPARDLGLRWFFCAGEGGGSDPAIRGTLAEGFGAKVFDHTGGGHAFHGISCEASDEGGEGMHFVSEDHCLLELVEPETKAPIELAHRAIGEMVFTFLDWRGGPFLRYALGDLLQVYTEPCRCGLPGIRFAILGRTDDMLSVKGVNVYPQAIANEIFRFHPRLTGAFRIVLDGPGPQVRAPLRIRLEHAGLDGAALAALERELLAQFRDRLRIRPAFEWLAPGTLPREAGKTKHIQIEGQRGDDDGHATARP
ncbi:MAG: AMP-binding protein [Burkholderiaceae bacterium]|nr:AMP-binding protein [Burkholderiaceae bacterium]